MSDFENASVDPGIEPDGGEDALGAGEFQEEAQDAGLGSEQEDSEQDKPASDDVLPAEEAGMTG